MNDNELCKLFEREEFHELTNKQIEQAIEYSNDNIGHLNNYYGRNFRLCLYYLKEEKERRKEIICKK